MSFKILGIAVIAALVTACTGPVSQAVSPSAPQTATVKSQICCNFGSA
jgi:hypothetical protein